MSSKPQSDMHVLIVDDEELICSLVSFFLVYHFDFKSVVVANNAQEASQKLQNQKFDLLIIDHVLPGKKGIELVTQLKSSVRFNKLRVLLISGFLEQGDARGAIEIGVKNILVKPFTRQQLVENVAMVMGITPRK